MLTPEEEEKVRRIIEKNQPAPAPATTSTLPPSAEAQIAQILAGAGDESAIEISFEQAEAFRSKFSWAALFSNVVYYYRVKDWLFFWISLISTLTIYLTPVLIPLAFYARRRAWQYGKWESESQFEKEQKRWDRNGWIWAIITVVLLYFLFRYLWGSLSSGLDMSNPTQVLNQVQGYTNGTAQ